MGPCSCFCPLFKLNENYSLEYLEEVFVEDNVTRYYEKTERARQKLIDLFRNECTDISMRYYCDKMLEFGDPCMHYDLDNELSQLDSFFVDHILPHMSCEEEAEEFIRYLRVLYGHFEEEEQQVYQFLGILDNGGTQEEAYECLSKVDLLVDLEHTEPEHKKMLIEKCILPYIHTNEDQMLINNFFLI